MSPRAFQTILVASMGSKDRLELESKVLAAALKQSHARGDTSGVSLAHKQIFLLLRQQQAADKPASDDTGNQTENRAPEPPVTPAEQPRYTSVGTESVTDVNAVIEPSGLHEKPKKMKKRVMPDIVWGDDSSGGDQSEDTSVEAVQVSPATENAAPAAESVAPAAEVGQEAVPMEPAERSPQDDGGIDLAASADVDLSESGDFESHVPGQPLLMDGDKAAFDAYGILQVEQIASFEEIHRSFLFLVRRVLMGLKKAKKKQRRPLLEQLQNLWIAHDILSDPVTRTDFDFRILGLRGAPDVIIHSAPEDKTDSISARTPLRIGELMQCAGLLEPTELEIAADMHRAMPEMLFGAFLVKQGFISEEDLQQVLMGQRLLKNGNLTVGHYQMCMKLWRESQTPIEETAVSEGFISQAEMERIVSAGLRDTAGVPAYQGGGVATNRGPAARINTEEAAKRVFRAERAVPQWKDQLDWSEPEAIEEYVAEDREQEQIRKPIRNNLDIEGVTDPSENKAKDPGKKSLRRLMEGLHSPEQPNVEDGGPPAKSLKSILSSGSEPLQGQVRVERLAAPTPAEEPSGAFSTLDAVGDTASAQPFADDVPSSEVQPNSGEPFQVEPLAEEHPRPKPGRPNIDFTIGGADDDTTGDAAPAAYDDSSIVETQALETPGLEIRSSEQSSSPEIVANILSEPGEGQPQFEAPDAVSDETTSEQLAVDPALLLHEEEQSTARPTTDVPVPRVVMEERSKPPAEVVEEDFEENVFGEVDYDDEDDAEREIDLGFIPELRGPTAELQKPESEPASSRKSDSEVSDRAPETPAVNMDDLLDFSTPIADSEAAEAAARAAAEAEAAEKAGIRTVLDEAFNGVKVPELPAQAPPPEEVLARRAEAEANFEAIAEEESQMQSGVYPIATLDDSSEKIDPVPPLSGEPAPVSTFASSDESVAPGSSSNDTVTNTGVNLTSDLLQSLDATISVNESSFRALNEHAKKEQMKQHVGEEGFVIPRGVERAPRDSQAETAPQLPAPQSAPPEMSQEMTMDFQNPLEVYAASEAAKATISMDVSPVNVSNNESELPPTNVKSFGAPNRRPHFSPSPDETVPDETAPVQASEQEAPSRADDEPSPGADAGSSDKKDDEDAVNPGSVDDTAGGAAADAGSKEDPQDRLKSGEWQIVYKLQGSLADVFLSEEAEPDMPKLRPRLTEIDSIIPSSIAKLTKGDADDKLDESSDEVGKVDPANKDATKSGDKKQSDKPVIKPVSNNYYRNDKTGQSGEDTGE